MEADGFFSQPHSYGLILNIDWFEPFEHSIYAVGVVFVALLNLPRDIQYNHENIIICGLIPGPKEPSLNVNSFLEPLVDDLLKLWRYYCQQVQRTFELHYCVYRVIHQL